MHTLFILGITIGLAVSPFVGSFIYLAFGYLGPFIFVTILAIPPIFIKCILKRINFSNDKQQQSRSFLKLILTNRNSLFMNVFILVSSLFLSSL